MSQEAASLKLKYKVELRKFDGEYEEGKTPVEVIEWEGDMPPEIAKQLLEAQNGTD